MGCFGKAFLLCFCPEIGLMGRNFENFLADSVPATQGIYFARCSFGFRLSRCALYFQVYEVPL